MRETHTRGRGLNLVHAPNPTSHRSPHIPHASHRITDDRWDVFETGWTFIAAP